jgi:hypothetical protein
LWISSSEELWLLHGAWFFWGIFFFTNWTCRRWTHRCYGSPPRINIGFFIGALFATRALTELWVLVTKILLAMIEDQKNVRHPQLRL